MTSDYLPFQLQFPQNKTVTVEFILQLPQNDIDLNITLSISLTNAHKQRLNTWLLAISEFELKTLLHNLRYNGKSNIINLI